MSAGKALLAGGARLLAAALAAGLALVWCAQVAADATLRAPAPTPVVLDRNGAFITQAGHQESGRIEYGYWAVQPPPRVVAATLALEDQRFWSHPGMDPLALARAAWRHAFGPGPRSGASTIAMQVARMQHPRPRTLWAKAVEAGVAVAITARYGHAAVLAQYFRLAPYGEGSHGIGHAAWWYFGRPAADLDWAQAALLAAVPQSPSRLAPRRNSARTTERATLALMRAGQPDAIASLPETHATPAPRRPQWTSLVLRLQARARVLPVDAGPLVHSSIDLVLQADMETLTAAQLREWRNTGAQQAALMVVDRPSGQVLAAIGSVPHAPGSGLDFLSAQRSPGSALKPFLYALALDRGVLKPDEVLLDAPEEAAGIGNADHEFLGPLLPRQALANSRNVPAAALLRRLGLEEGFAYLRSLGLHNLDGDPIRFGLGMSIGTLPTTLERLVRAYAALADDGRWRELHWLQGEAEAPPRSIATQAGARLVTRFLSDPMARLPSFPRYGSSEYPLPVALKTGTSQGYRDAWTLAWSGKLLVGAWVGRPDDASMDAVSGARSAAKLVQAVLLRLHRLGRADLVAGDFASPQGQPAAEICAAPSGAGACTAHAQEFVSVASRPEITSPALRIIQPAANLHVWRNPELPASLDRLLLKASVPAGVTQVTWVVDGEALATVAPEAAGRVADAGRAASVSAAVAVAAGGFGGGAGGGGVKGRKAVLF